MRLFTEHPYLTPFLLIVYACIAIYLLREYGNRYPQLTAKRAVLVFLGSLLFAFLLLRGLLGVLGDQP